MLKEIDEFVVEQLDKVIQFVQDWLFFSQRQIERGLIVLFLLICILNIYLACVVHGSLLIEILADLVMFLEMVSEHLQTKTERTERKLSGYMWRVWWIFLCIGDLLFILLFHEVQPKVTYTQIYINMGLVWMATRTLMTYITVLDIEGEKGRAARLSWKKLKELFGTEWVPQPQEPM